MVTKLIENDDLKALQKAVNVFLSDNKTKKILSVQFCNYVSIEYVKHYAVITYS